MPRSFIQTTDENDFLAYIQNNPAVYNMVSYYATPEGRKQEFNNATFNVFHSRLFDNGNWPYNVQNDTLFMLLYACSGKDKYIDASIDAAFRNIADTMPVSRVYQNEMLAGILPMLSRYIPYDQNVRELCNYIEFAIHANTIEIKKEDPYYNFPELPENERQEREIYRNDLFIEFNDIKHRLENNGWDFSDPEDEEFIRTLMDLKLNNPETGGEIFDAFMEKAGSTKISDHIAVL